MTSASALRPPAPPSTPPVDATPEHFMLPGPDTPVPEAAAMYQQREIQSRSLWWVVQGARTARRMRVWRPSGPTRGTGKHPVAAKGWTTNPVDLGEVEEAPAAGPA